MCRSLGQVGSPPLTQSPGKADRRGLPATVGLSSIHRMPCGVTALSWGGSPRTSPCFPSRGNLHSITGWEGYKKEPVTLPHFSTILQGSPSSWTPLGFSESLLLLLHRVFLFLPGKRSTPSLPASLSPADVDPLVNSLHIWSPSQSFLPRKPNQCHWKSINIFLKLKDSETRKFSWLHLGLHISENCLKPYNNIAITNISTNV